MLNKIKKITCVLCSVFLILFATVPASASTDFDLDILFESIKNNDYVKEFTQGKYYFATTYEGVANTFLYLYVTSEQYTINFNNTDILIPSSECDRYEFIINDNSNIVFHELSNSFSDYYVTVCDDEGISNGSLVFSNYDIKRADGTVFFQPPTLLRRLLSQVRPSLEPTTTQTVSTLVLCGVGLMALLIGLYLLPKVLHKYLN